MSPSPHAPGTPVPVPFKARLIGGGVWVILSLYSCLLRWRCEDRTEGGRSELSGSMIWITWHNRIIALAPLWKKYLRSRRGAVLTSASRDGDIIAAYVNTFGVSAVRGSSSRRGATALLGLIDWIKAGYDVCVIPDGPRGPRYRLAPGVVKLAQVTGAAVLPIRVEYSRYWSFKSWDRFRVPQPFSTVTIILEPLMRIPTELSESEFECLRQELERVMNPDHETD